MGAVSYLPSIVTMAVSLIIIIIITDLYSAFRSEDTEALEPFMRYSASKNSVTLKTG